MNSNPSPTLWADGMDHFNSIPVSCIRHCHAQGRTGWRLLCGLLCGQPSCAHNKSRCREGQLITNNWLPIARFVQVQKFVTIVLIWHHLSLDGPTLQWAGLVLQCSKLYSGMCPVVQKTFWSLLACDIDWPIIRYWGTIASPNSLQHGKW